MREEPQTPFQIVADPVLHAACIALTRTYIEDRPVISSWNSLIDYCRVCLAYQPREQLHLLFLNRRNVLIADETQQVGSIDHTPIYPREVVKAALRHDASAVILVHNHPSGDFTPSRADIEMTKQVADALKTVGITLHDHLIVSAGGHTSFRTEGLM